MKIVLFVLSLATLAHAAEPRWWKGNLHTHTLWSDGDDFPEMIADWYKQHGYDFLALSDHNIIADREKWISIAKSNLKTHPEAIAKYKARFGDKWVELREKDGDQEIRLKMLSEFRPALEEPGKFLMIPAEEITSEFLKSPIHINATNIREKIEPQKGTNFVDVMQKTVDAVYAQRERLRVPMFPHINHPNFGYALTAEDLAQVEHDHFFEVYNGHPQVYNEGNKLRADTDRIWDVLLTKRLAETGKGVVYGMGVDDSHNYHPLPPPDAAPKKEATPKAESPQKDAVPKEGSSQPETPKEPAPAEEPAKTEPSKEGASAPAKEPPATGDEKKPKPKPAVLATPKKPAPPSRPGRGWVMIRAEKLEPEALIAALEAGDFYASSGVTLKEVVREKNRLAVEIAGEDGVTYTTEFFGTRKGYNGASEPVVDAKGVTLRTTQRYSKDVGAVLATVTGTSASYELKGDEIYVRARITSSKPKENASYPEEKERAWTQPVVTGVK